MISILAAFDQGWSTRVWGAFEYPPLFRLTETTRRAHDRRAVRKKWEKAKRPKLKRYSIFMNQHRLNIREERKFRSLYTRLWRKRLPMIKWERRYTLEPQVADWVIESLSGPILLKEGRLGGAYGVIMTFMCEADLVMFQLRWM